MYAVQERFEFQFERLVLDDQMRLDANLPLGAYFDAKQFLLCVIEAQIGARLEDSELADTLGRGAAGRKIGDDASREFHAYVGNIHFFAQNMDARRLDCDGFFPR